MDWILFMWLMPIVSISRANHPVLVLAACVTRVSCTEMDAVSASQIQEKLKQHLQAEQVDVIDTSGGCGSAFQVAIVSDAFRGKRLLERHQLVHQVLEEELKTIHALSITKAVTLEQAKATSK